MPTQIFEGANLFIEGTADSEKARVTDGVDTFVFRGDGMQVQTLRWTVEVTAWTTPAPPAFAREERAWLSTRTSVRRSSEC